MKLENQVCSLKLSERLKELGVIQQSLFWWIRRKGQPNATLTFGRPHFTYTDHMNGLMYDAPLWENTGWDFYSAFTVSELGEMLPGGMIQTETNNITRYPDIKKFMLLLSGSSHHVTDDNEANTRAKMFIYLFENKLSESQNET